MTSRTRSALSVVSIVSVLAGAATAAASPGCPVTATESWSVTIPGSYQTMYPAPCEPFLAIVTLRNPVGEPALTGSVTADYRPASGLNVCGLISHESKGPGLVASCGFAIPAGGSEAFYVNLKNGFDVALTVVANAPSLPTNPLQVELELHTGCNAPDGHLLLERDSCR